MKTFLDQAVELFCELVELEPGARACRLGELEARDPELAAKVLEMLADDRDADARLDRRAIDLVDTDFVWGARGELVRSEPDPLPLLERIGPYRIVDTLGGGGMGVVYEAEEEHPHRRVALKVLRGDLVSLDRLERSRREAQVLAHVQHPGIAQVFAAGAEGQHPYIAMELVRGRPIDRYAAEEGLAVHERLRLFLAVTDAVQHAHVQGIVHRDLKPDNILVDAHGRPKVLDFGVARITGVDLSVASFQVGTGQVVGTLPYMSPEQAAGGFDDLSPASDVYSLGVVLYELLAGDLPYAVRKQPLHHVLRVIQEEPPAPLRAVAPMVPRDLETVVHKALEKDEARRYATVAELAADLQRVLLQEPVTARRPTLGYRLNNYVVRKKRWVYAGLMVLAVALAGLLGTRNAVEAARTGNLRADQLLDLRRLEILEREADTLWPASEETAPRMRAWVDEAQGLISRLPEHERSLEAGFGAEDDALASLVMKLRLFGADDAGTASHVRARLREAETLRARSIEAYRSEWDRALASIADRDECPLYDGLELAPQLGLVPLGRDAESGLWEFAHLQSGAPAFFDEEGGARMARETGLVFVLVPGGSTLLGAQNVEPAGPRYDPLAQDLEGPPVRVELDPFLVSKFELTADQWQRLAGSNPSYYPEGRLRAALRAEHAGGTPRVGQVVAPGAVGSHPVENVSWHECRGLLGRAGLDLPSEAQWEHAARGGTQGPWSTGSTKESLAGAANLADAYAREQNGSELWDYEDTHFDGFKIHAPVGSLEPNPFGLYDVHGNVAEWCKDQRPYFDRDRLSTDGDGLHVVERPRAVARGGSFASTADRARSSVRWVLALEGKSDDIGLRPCLRLER